MFAKSIEENEKLLFSLFAKLEKIENRLKNIKVQIDAARYSGDSSQDERWMQLNNEEAHINELLKRITKIKELAIKEFKGELNK